MKKKSAKFTPDWHFETSFSGISANQVTGVDEAGRGPLAGPVVAAAVILPTGFAVQGLTDSKKLSQARREAFFASIMSSAKVGIGIAEPEEIERINILQASLIAMQRAVLNLPQSPKAVLVDGNQRPDFNLPVRAIVKGDSRSYSIAAASIMAKVTRDELMVAADLRYPQYGFSGHKGYPTKTHRAALAKHGACPIHRRSYVPVKAVLTSIDKRLNS